MSLGEKQNLLPNIQAENTRDIVYSFFYPRSPPLPYSWKTGDQGVAIHILVLALELEITDVKKQVQQCLGRSVPAGSAAGHVASLGRHSIISVGWP